MNLNHTLLVAALLVAGNVSAAEPSARDYVQTALVGQFDGIENAGYRENAGVIECNVRVTNPDTVGDENAKNFKAREGTLV